MNRFLTFSLFLLLAWFVSVGAIVTAQGQNDTSFTVHVVQRGENLFRIALQYDLFAEQVATANGIADTDAVTVGQRLIIPLVVNSVGERITHIASIGETFNSIAAAYSMPVDELMSLNNLSVDDAIVSGQELVIVAGDPAGTPTPDGTNAADSTILSEPSSPTGSGASLSHSFARFGDPPQEFIHAVQSGDTLSAIGLRYNQTLAALVQANNLANPGLLSIGQRLVIPGIALPQLTLALPVVVDALTLEPLVFSEGHTGRIELLTREAVQFSGQFLGQELQIIEREDGRRHNILVGIPMFTPMDVYPLTLQIHGQSEEPLPISANIQVIYGGFGSQSITIDDNELLAPAVEDNEVAILTNLTRTFTPRKSWNSALSLPAAAGMNALFGTLRSYNGGPFDRYHSGVDFAGAPGTAIQAAADGQVVMVDRLHIRGNTVMIDHGWGVFTVYAHQQETLVELGAAVLSGQVIGTVGSTGRSTGPHLHWEVWINGVNVDPLQWVQETFP